MSSCPMRRDSNDTSVIASLEEAAKHSQKPHPGQQIPLSTHRVVSSIPRKLVEEKTPHHQPKDASAPNWIYPSEQQFYNAMRRKGWDPDERDVPTVVQIHNFVNEQCWREIRKWEPNDPQLSHFIGRPKDLSPKAFLNTYLFNQRPFDRHDWFVDGGNGVTTRYVLDFYMDQSTPVPLTRVDVRPALDTPQAFFQIFKIHASNAFPGIATALSSFRSSNKKE